MATKGQIKKLKSYLRKCDDTLSKTYEYEGTQVFTNSFSGFMLTNPIKDDEIEMSNDYFGYKIYELIIKADRYKYYYNYSQVISLKTLKDIRKRAKDIAKNDPSLLQGNYKYKDESGIDCIIFEDKTKCIVLHFGNDIYGNNIDRMLKIDFVIDAMEILNYKKMRMMVYMELNEPAVDSNTYRKYFNDIFSIITYMVKDDEEYIPYKHDKCIILPTVEL